MEIKLKRRDICGYCGQSTRPKPSVKRPEKYDTFKKLKNGEPCNHPGCLSHVSHPCEGCGRVAGRYLPYPAAAEAAGLEYGLDEKGILNVIINTPKNCDDTLNIDRIAYNLKLAERELITRKKTTP